MTWENFTGWFVHQKSVHKAQHSNSHGEVFKAFCDIFSYWFNTDISVWLGLCVCVCTGVEVGVQEAPPHAMTARTLALVWPPCMGHALPCTALRHPCMMAVGHLTMATRHPSMSRGLWRLAGQGPGTLLTPTHHQGKTLFKFRGLWW